MNLVRGLCAGVFDRYGEIEALKKSSETKVPPRGN
jgi:hypothetical protein